jgi:hypothetical protein
MDYRGKDYEGSSVYSSYSYNYCRGIFFYRGDCRIESIIDLRLCCCYVDLIEILENLRLC